MSDSALAEFLAIHSEYTVLGTVGRGGMSSVYLAEQLRLQRRVAIKVMDGSLADDPRSRERFLRETRAVASIDHPGVLPIYDAGEAGQALFTVMRYVDGPDLRKFLRANGPQPLEDATRIGSQVADALGAAHAKGLVHRDVKPANILLTSSNIRGAHSYLCDFGLVKRLDSGPSLTKMDEIVGTIDYIAPEQIEGGIVDARTDIYSLACVVYEMLAGSPPYKGHSDVSVLWSHLRDAPPPLRAALPDVPAKLEDLLKASMSKAPSDRPASAAEFALALRACAIEASSSAGESNSGPGSTEPDRGARSSSQTLSKASLLTTSQAGTESTQAKRSGPDATDDSGDGSSEPPGGAVDSQGHGDSSAATNPRNHNTGHGKALLAALAIVIVAAALIVGLVIKPWGGSTPNDSMTMSAGSSTGSTALTSADMKLLNYVDPEIRGSCKHYSDLSSWELAVAGVTCTPPHDADSVTYLQLKGSSDQETEAKLHHHFFGLVPSEYNGQPPPAGSCATASNFTALQQGPLATEGRSLAAQLLACFHHHGNGEPELIWTTWNPYVLAWATGSNPGSLLQYWQFTLGPCQLQNASQSCNQT